MGHFAINVITLDRVLLDAGIVKGLVVRLESLLQQVCTDIIYSSVREVL